MNSGSVLPVVAMFSTSTPRTEPWSSRIEPSVLSYSRVLRGGTKVLGAEALPGGNPAGDRQAP